MTVDITTVVHGDGSCTRRTVYRLQRVDSEDKGTPPDLPQSEDPLRLLHRFPSGEAWTVQHEVKGNVHGVTLEGTFPSPNDLDWDYWRAASPKALPARNHLSFAKDEDEASPRYEYSETFLDPASPLLGLRSLSELLRKREDLFGREILRRLDGAAVSRAEIVRAVRETLTVPFAGEVAALASRPVYGPRERLQTAKLVDRLTELAEALTDRLVTLAPGLGPEKAKKALDEAFDALGDSMDSEDGGLPILWTDAPKIHFHAILVMPAPVVRANACAQGDTVTWDFEGDDLYGRGFEMWAVAAAVSAPSVSPDSR